MSRYRQTLKNRLPQFAIKWLRKTRRQLLNLRDPQKIFREIYSSNAWDGTESVSGPGSTMDATKGIREALPGLIVELKINTLLDVPCGDVYWISSCLPKSVQYIGGDIVPELIERNRQKFPSLGSFMTLDLVRDDLPKSDMILIRDCMIHLPNYLIIQALGNIKRSASTYLLATTYEGLPENINIEIGGYRRVNLSLPPFNLPRPSKLIKESEGKGKCMGLWRIADL